MNSGAAESEDVIADLRRRLQEAEDTLTAIRQGEVDALVIAGGGNDAIFTIEGEGAYRSLLEAIDPGAMALDEEGRILYANTRAAGLLGRSVSALQGESLAAVLGAADTDELDALLDRSLRERRTCKIMLDKGNASGRQYEVCAAPLRVGTVTGYAVTIVDVTERMRAELAEQRERAATAVLSSANEAVVVCDGAGLITHANAAAAVLHEKPLVGLPFSDAVPLVFARSTGYAKGHDIVAQALAGEAVQGVEATAPGALVVKDFLVSAAPLRVTGDQITGCVITMTDLSQRKAAEKQQLLLMAELDHRVKNTLALVLAISTRTLSSETTLNGFHDAFVGRIQALAATHNLLADRSWSKLQVGDVLQSELAPFIGNGTGRISAEGLDVTITPRAAIALGLILHELATNAVKYGALSNDEGEVSVRIRDRGDDSRPLLFEWRETGGPQVKPPTRRGFGRTVISRSLQYSPEGKAELTFSPEGVVCNIAIPSEDVV